MKLLIIIFCLLSTSLISYPFSKDLMQEGHSVYLTQDAGETQEWKIRLIREAKESLEISTGFCLGQVFEDLLETIHEKLIENSKIKINLLLFQALSFISEKHIQFLDDLQSLYADRFTYFITTASGLMQQGGKIYVTENHTKLMIVDEKYILLGGTNLVDQLSTPDVTRYPTRVDTLGSGFLPDAAIDMDAIIRGPIAKKLRQEYYLMLALFKSEESLDQNEGEYQCSNTDYYPIPEAERAEILYFDNHPETAHQAKVFGAITGPRMQLHTIGNIYEDLIRNAESSIDIGNMFFFPCSSIFEALLAASNRGINISLVTNGVHNNASLNNSTRSTYGHLNRLNYLPLMSGEQFRFWEIFTAKDAPQKNVKVYELDSSNVLYHKKVMTVDHLFSVIGSYNLGMKSEDADYEVAVVIESQKTALRMETILQDDKEISLPIPYDQAFGWYYCPYYNLIEAIQRKFLDGTFL